MSILDIFFYDTEKVCFFSKKKAKKANVAKMLPNVAKSATCCHFVQNCPKMDNFFFCKKCCQKKCYGNKKNINVLKTRA